MRKMVNFGDETALKFDFKENYNIDDLVRIVSILRQPGGCPWDAEQNHKSIRQNFIEEVYEAIEAIDTDDTELLKEELGDVLLQVVFHSIMESEKNSFTFDDVADGICKKLIVRHPHVFGDVKVNGTDDVLSNWDEIKKKTKSQKTQSEAMASVSKSLPALMRSEKIQKKAAKVGFDWSDISGCLDKLEEEVAELRKAVSEGDSSNMQEELGDVIFSAVNVSRFIDCDAEYTLTLANEKFLSRFSKVEKMAAERGIDMKNSSLEQLDKLWDEAKLMK